MCDCWFLRNYPCLATYLWSSFYHVLLTSDRHNTWHISFLSTARYWPFMLLNIVINLLSLKSKLKFLYQVICFSSNRMSYVDKFETGRACNYLTEHKISLTTCISLSEIPCPFVLILYFVNKILLFPCNVQLLSERLCLISLSGDLC